VFDLLQPRLVTRKDADNIVQKSSFCRALIICRCFYIPKTPRARMVVDVDKDAYGVPMVVCFCSRNRFHLAMGLIRENGGKRSCFSTAGVVLVLLSNFRQIMSGISC
jgi:hypothetical protein